MPENEYSTTRKASADSITAEDYLVLPGGQYLAEFSDYDLQDGTWGPMYKLFFKILEQGEFEGETTSGLANAKLTPKSKLKRWLEGLLGRPIEAGEQIKFPDLLKMKCYLILTEEETKDGYFNRIETILPFKRPPARRRRGAQPQQVASRPQQAATPTQQPTSNAIPKEPDDLFPPDEQPLFPPDDEEVPADIPF